MKIEIVEFYLSKDKSSGTVGSLHIYLCDYGIDIRGCPVVRKPNGKWLFFLPSKTSFDVDNNKEISYPVIEFTSSEKKQEILDFLKENGPEFVNEKIKTTPRRAKPVFKSPLKKGASRLKNRESSLTYSVKAEYTP